MICGANQHSRPDGNIGETTEQPDTVRSEALTDQRRGSLRDTVAGHIAETFGSDGERVGGNGDDTERCDDHRRCNLRPANGHVLESHRQGDAESFTQRLFSR